MGDKSGNKCTRIAATISLFVGVYQVLHEGNRFCNKVVLNTGRPGGKEERGRGVVKGKRKACVLP